MGYELNHFIHGHARVGKHTRTYRIWTNLKNRCLNKRNVAYELYGGRGITIAEKWLNFPGFLEDMGECPPGKQIDRIDNDKGYSKANCRWATPKQNSRNRRSSIRHFLNGEYKTVPEYADKYKIVRHRTIYERLLYGWDIKRAVLTPLAGNRKGKPYVG